MLDYISVKDAAKNGIFQNAGCKSCVKEARLMVIGGRGFMPVEGVKRAENFGSSISRVPLSRDGSQTTRNYCAFWKKDNSGYYIEEFADILKGQFE